MTVLDVEGANDKTHEFSTSAPPFVPAEELEPELALPAGHLAQLRKYFWDPSGNWMQYYVGTLNSFSHLNGYGFLKCRQAHKDWGRDVFIHKSHVPKPWRLGQPVEFAVTVNLSGHPQAVDVNWLPPLPSAPAGPNGPAQVTSDAIVAGSDVGPALLRLGSLKSFSSLQGYGFIMCEETQAMYNRDIYFDKNQLPETHQVGQVVMFTVAHNARGQPQARDARWEPIPWLPESRQEKRRVNSTTMSNLRVLLQHLNDREDSTAIYKAMSFSNGAASDSQNTVDYVCFVLDIVDPKCKIKALVKMMLLLMLSRMLRKPYAEERCAQLARWVTDLAESIDLEDKDVKAHFVDTFGKLSSYMEAAAACQRDHKDTLMSAMQTLGQRWQTSDE